MIEIIELLQKYDIKMSIDPGRVRKLDEVLVIELQKGNHHMSYAIDYLDKIKYKDMINDLIPELIVDFAKEVDRKEVETAGFKINSVDVLPCTCEDRCHPVDKYKFNNDGLAEKWLECPGCHKRSVSSTDFDTAVRYWNNSNKVEGLRDGYGLDA